MQLWLIPILPLLGAALNGLTGRRTSQGIQSAIAVGSVLLSFLWVLNILVNNMPAPGAEIRESYFTWISSGNFSLSVDLVVDRLTAVMLLVVTGIGTLIHIYATSYMSHEGGFYRFFTYLNLFMFFMLVLVMSGNFLLLFVGWEGVGLCSYLLIGFYFLKKSASDAGKKAFIVNRIGDFGVLLAMLLLINTFGSLDFKTIADKVNVMPVELTAGIITAICLLLLLGAAGKSAQIPLYTWLPDAMEGPTPVSALIHAATMVTAGVYLCCRASALFEHAPIAQDTVAYIGLATAFFAATIGLVQNDIKKVYAYSTVSQLGFMFLAVGSGAYAAAIFHVVTHAFFKALLFLGSGSVIHALEGEQDMRQMGGLRGKLPITFFTLLMGALAIAGFPFFSGWYSKEAILSAAHAHAPWMFWVAALTAMMTAFYVFRTIWLTFFGEYKGHAHPHESPAVMWIPLAVLAVLSVIGGFLFNVPHFLEGVLPAHVHGHDMTLEIIGSSAGLLGIALSYLFYVASPGLADSFATSFSGLYNLVYNKYFVDEVYDAAVVHPIERTSRGFLWKFLDQNVIDDGMVHGATSGALGLGSLLRLLQGGVVRNYATWVVLGAVFIFSAFSLLGGAR
ncbi:MAG: NADH-quinone oxidoreductase subunit L [Acidobacteriia bacterium 12-62-4]|nr:MAG: NADH-quinone oxidoreductase subunit L [Acidobacteriia bacterium 12-62-4]